MVQCAAVMNSASPGRERAGHSFRLVKVIDAHQPMNSRIVVRRSVTQHPLTMRTGNELQTSAAGIDRLEGHPNTDFIIARGVVIAKSFILVPWCRRADTGGL